MQKALVFLPARATVAHMSERLDGADVTLGCLASGVCTCWNRFRKGAVPMGGELNMPSRDFQLARLI